jgi:hypothetical protein
MLQRTIRIDTTSAIGTNEDHILDVDDIWRAFEKSIVSDGVLVRKDS